MGTGRTIIISAILVLGAAGSGTAMSVATGTVASVQVQAAATHAIPNIMYQG
jgi:hypothetical protein